MPEENITPEALPHEGGEGAVENEENSTAPEAPEETLEGAKEEVEGTTQEEAPASCPSDTTLLFYPIYF